MSTLTAQILVGGEHSPQSGVIPTHQLLLFENDRPAWILIPVNAFEMVAPPERRITWIPTVENMLEDALLMIALYVQQGVKMATLAKQHLRAKQEDWVELDKDTDAEGRQALYEGCREVEFGRKLVVTVLQGSTIQGQLEALKQYRITAEVCVSQPPG